jgi:hypothetical protein
VRSSHLLCDPGLAGALASAAPIPRNSRIPRSSQGAPFTAGCHENVTVVVEN